MEGMPQRGSETFLQISLIKKSSVESIQISHEIRPLNQLVTKELVYASQILRKEESRIMDNLVGEAQSLLSLSNNWRNRILKVLTTSLGNMLDILGNKPSDAVFPNQSDTKVGNRISFPQDPSRIAFLFDEPRSHAIASLVALRAIDEKVLKDSGELLAVSKAAAIASLLEAVMDNYERAFSDYVKRVLDIIPNISKLKPTDYCRNMRGAGAQTELDLSFDPSNTLIVDEIIEYYAASEMLEAERCFAKRSDILAYSHQHCGWTNGIAPIILNDDPQLIVTMRTNLGYGRRSWFRATLSFRGLSVINADMIIYYEHADLLELANTTWIYDVRQESFDACFADAIQSQENLKKLGERGFVEKYVIGSVSKLIKALHDISSSEHFLLIADAALLMDLTSSTHSTFLRGSYESPATLDDLDAKSLEHFAHQTSCKSTFEGKYYLTIPDGEVSLIQKQFALREDRSALEQDERARLAKAALTSSLAKIHGEALPLFVINEFVESVLPSNTAYTVKHCHGVDINLERTRLAQRVVKLSESLTATCETAERLDLLQELISVCETIRQQNMPAQKTLTDMFETAEAQALTLEDALASTAAREQSTGEEHKDDALEINWRIQESKDTMEKAAKKLHALEQFSVALDAWKTAVASRELSPITSGGAE